MLRSVFLTFAAVVALVAAPGIGAVADTAGSSAAQVVHTKDFAFSPATVNVKTGDTVQFVNDDEVAHTVTASDKSFDSGNMDQHATWSHTFAKAGTYAYICTYHPYMKGTIVVADPGT